MANPNNASSQILLIFFNNKSPVYMNVLKEVGNLNTNTRASLFKLSQTLQKSNQGQNKLFYLAPNT